MPYITGIRKCIKKKRPVAVLSVCLQNHTSAAQAIRGLPDPALAGIPIIAMTANAFQEDIKKAEAVGINGHIAKPLDVPDMKDTLQQVLKNNMQRRAVYSGGEEE